MRAGNFPNDREPNAAAAVRRCRAAARERSPDPFPILRRDARPFVLDRDADSAVFDTANADANRLPAWTVLHRVVEEIQHDVPERVGAERDRRAWNSIDHDGRAPRGSDGAEFLRDGRDLATDVNQLALRRIFRAKRRKAEHVLHEVRETLRLAIYMTKRPTLLLFGGGASKLQSVEIEPDLRDRRTQLVGHARDEPGSQ